jgi:hypothetical protein
MSCRADAAMPSPPIEIPPWLVTPTRPVQQGRVPAREEQSEKKNPKWNKHPQINATMARADTFVPRS